MVTLPKEAQVANALITHESDLFGSLKATGALAPKAIPETPARSRPLGTDSDRPINPKIIGTAADVQLNAAVELLGGHRAAAR